MSYPLQPSILISLLAASLLTACGGDSKTVDTDPADAAYTGNRDQVPLTLSTARDFTDTLFDGEDFNDFADISGRAQASQNLPGLLKQQQYLLNIATPYSNNSSLQQRSFDRSCDFGGSVNIDEDINILSRLGSFTFNFTGCRQTQAVQIDGEMFLIVDDYDSQGNPSETSLSMNNLSLAEDSIQNRFTGVIQNQVSGATTTQTTDLHSLNLSNNDQFYLQNLQIIDSVTDSISGRIYDGDKGYIRLSSSTDLMITGAGVPTQGFIYLHGADNSTARLSQSSDSAITLELDEDGDGTYEHQEIVDITG